MVKVLRSRTGRRRPADPVYRVQVLDRAFQLLGVLAVAPDELGIAALAERVSLHKSTTHRLLSVLERHRLVRKHPVSGAYGLGLKLFELGARAVQQVELTERALPYLRKLMEETQETANLSVLDGQEVVSIVDVEGPWALRIHTRVGRRSALHCTAVGKAAIAFLPAPALDALLRTLPLPRRTARTIVRRSALERELARVRQHGFAMDNEEGEVGLRCVGAPIRHHSGKVFAAVSVAGPASRMTKERMRSLARAVVATADAISVALGYHEAKRTLKAARRA